MCDCKVDEFLLFFLEFSRWGSLKDRGSSSSIGSDSVFRGSARLSDADSGVDGAVHSFRKAAVYVFGEKAQIKVIFSTKF